MRLPNYVSVSSDPAGYSVSRSETLNKDYEVDSKTKVFIYFEYARLTTAFYCFGGEMHLSTNNWTGDCVGLSSLLGGATEMLAT